MARKFGAALCVVAGCLFLASSALAAPYDPHTVIVKYSSGLSSATKSKIASRAGVLSRVGGIHGTGVQVVRVSGDPAAVAARLNRDAGVAYAEPNYILRANAIPNDPRFGELYGLNNTGQGGGTPDPRGKMVFEGACVSCHGWTGESSISPFATLTGAWAVNDPGATNVAQIVISGTKRHTPKDAISMPAFGDAYSDAEIAAVANYVTSRFGRKGSQLTAQDVAELRKQTSE